LDRAAASYQGFFQKSPNGQKPLPEQGNWGIQNKECSKWKLAVGRGFDIKKMQQKLQAKIPPGS